MLCVLVILMAAGCTLRASAEPSCEFDRQCQSGFYCVPNVFLCRRCLDCESLKRDPPRVPTACIKSVAECGSCIKGLVDDLGGDVTAECVAEVNGAAAGAGAALPAWAWAAVTMGLVLFALVMVAVLYMLRNTNTFKILASTRTSVRSPGAMASAPDEPPPYRAHYHHHDDHSDQDTEVGLGRARLDLLPEAADPSAPWDGDSPPASPRATSKPRPPPAGSREAAARQATRFYSAPYYVRPPRYSDAGVSSPAPPVPPPAPAPPALHDEDTMESTWTPGAHDANGNAAGGGELAELLAAARLADQQHNHPHQHHQHHHPYPCTQDSNNNRSSGSAAGGDPRGPPPTSTAAPAPVSYIINVVQNMQK